MDISFFFFFKLKTAYEMRISDWSSDVCSSDLGTGHGGGSFLSVHEGPQRIATFGGGDEPLQPGMILSNEPGYYKTGEYGIRIENLVLVEKIGRASCRESVCQYV